MRDKGQMKSIVKFVGDNPGCSCAEVISGTGMPKFAVTSALFKLVGRGELKRIGQPKRYRYYAVQDKDIPIRNYDGKAEVYDHDMPNPLTAIFNQRLLEVRRCLSTSQS